jgi:hypothetical protein
VTNYISRQTFSVPAPFITAHYPVTHIDLAKILGAFHDEVLCPQLQSGDVVVIDNLSSHKVDQVLQCSQDRQAELLYPPPNSPT